ncbi:MAG: DUF433 domain-containing protein [Desulfomonilaceae bacterium]
MRSTITEIIGDEVYEYVPLGDYVVKAKGVCGGRPTFKYTRILVAGILDRIEAGESIETITKNYNGRITKEAIVEAMNIRSAKNIRRKVAKRVAA